MAPRLKILFFFILSFSLFHPASGLHAAKIEKFTLENGLAVLLVEEHKAPVVTFQVWYKVGSRNEITGKTGLSHLLEHMMFKGTPRHGKGEFSRIVAKNGGTENAFTGNDYTAYFENFSSDRIELSIELESDRMQNLLMDPKEFQLEREVVKEERRTRTDDDPYSYLIENLYAVTFLVHPYHNPVIGWMSDLDRLTPEDALHYYKHYYIPNNATIVVVGDFDTGKLLPKIKEKFEKIPRGKEPVQSVSPEPKQLGERRTVVKREAQLPFVFLAYPTPNYKNPDNHALTVLSTLLSSGKSSRLYRSLVYDQQIALDAGGRYEGLTTDPELFYFYATARPGKGPEDLEKALNAEIGKLQTNPVTENELQKAKNQIEAQFIMGADSNFFQAMLIGSAETVGAGHQYISEFIDKIRKVTAADITRVAKKYLLNDTKNVGILLPTPPSEVPADADAPAFGEAAPGKPSMESK